MYGRKTLRIIPVTSSDSDCSAFSSELGGEPVSSPFFRIMREYAANRGQALGSPYSYGSDDHEVMSPISTRSETTDQYNMRIKRQNECVKRVGTMGFIGCLACLFVCF
tara:strand:- start:265 stop:588 length:324 start_codon:yes stop_codon:yes gene_type:complete